MKKRTLALTLALGCVFMSPVLSYAEENTEAEVVSEKEEDSGTDERNNNSWGKVAIVDDFGDATGQSAIRTVVTCQKGIKSLWQSSEQLLNCQGSLIVAIPAVLSAFRY